ncbi:helix-turn-helix domain-containing protein [Weissella viridescens]|uniref:helix-turn-helix domain-containing protein n=1 Tax=Weissella viridescens TaxID=1629 RepID=UPI00352806B2
MTLDMGLRREFNKRVKQLKEHGDEYNRTLPNTMVARKIGISATTLSKILSRKKINVSQDTYIKIEEWLDEQKVMNI